MKATQRKQRPKRAWSRKRSSRRFTFTYTETWRKETADFFKDWMSFILGDPTGRLRSPLENYPRDAPELQRYLKCIKRRKSGLRGDVVAHKERPRLQHYSPRKAWMISEARYRNGPKVEMEPNNSRMELRAIDHSSVKVVSGEQLPKTYLYTSHGSTPERT